jgi:hypothetical protein
MDSKISREYSDLENALQEQIFLMESSIISFDLGHFEEGKRIATSLRILLHDTSTSKSLLGQLGVKDKLWFYDVAREYDGQNLLSEDLLLNILSPRLQLSSETRTKKFDEWWDKQVIMSTGGISPITFTRKGFILFLANQDGRAHVDPLLDRHYYEMTRNNKYGWFLKDNESESETPLSNKRVELSVRTIAFEVCATLYVSNRTLVFRTIRQANNN